MTDKWPETRAVILDAVARALDPVKDQKTTLELSTSGRVTVVRLVKNNIRVAVAITMVLYAKEPE